MTIYNNQMVECRLFVMQAFLSLSLGTFFGDLHAVPSLSCLILERRTLRPCFKFSAVS